MFRRKPGSAASAGMLGVLALVMAWPQISQAQPPPPLNPDDTPVVPLDNILKNGDFETLNDALEPSGWQLPANTGAPDGATPNGPAFELVKADNGNHYALLRPVGTGVTRRIAHKIMVSPVWKTLKITARVMGKNLEGGPKQYEDAHIGLVFFNALDREVGYAIPLTLSADAAWTTLSGIGEVPADAQYVVLDVANFGVGGEFGIDDIKVEPNAPIEAPLLDEEFDGSFEPLADGQPKGWPVKGHQHIEVRAENGQHFLRLTNEALEQSVEMATIWKLAPRMRRVRIQAMMRGRNIQPGKQPWETARLGVVFADIRGARHGDWPPSLELRADTNWKIFTETLPIPPGAVFLRVTPTLLNTRGTFDIKDIQIEQSK